MKCNIDLQELLCAGTKQPSFVLDGAAFFYMVTNELLQFVLAKYQKIANH